MIANLIPLLAVPMSHVTRDFLYSCTILNEGHPLGAHFGELESHCRTPAGGVVVPRPKAKI